MPLAVGPEGSRKVDRGASRREAARSTGGTEGRPQGRPEGRHGGRKAFGAAAVAAQFVEVEFQRQGWKVDRRRKSQVNWKAESEDATDDESRRLSSKAELEGSSTTQVGG